MHPHVRLLKVWLHQLFTGTTSNDLPEWPNSDADLKPLHVVLWWQAPVGTGKVTFKKY
jgi:hypothetical protein